MVSYVSLLEKLMKGWAIVHCYISLYLFYVQHRSLLHWQSHKVM